VPCRRRRRRCLCCIKHATSGICLLQLPIHSCPIYSCLIGSCIFAAATLFFDSCCGSLSYSTLAAGRSQREYACTSEVHSEVLLLRVALLLSTCCESLTTRVREYVCTSECTPEPQNARHTSECRRPTSEWGGAQNATQKRKRIIGRFHVSASAASYV
jgi:hypothetical protein